MFAERGAHVYVADVLDDEGKAVVEDIRASGGSSHYVHLDVSDAGNWRDVVDQISATSGALHVLVNNAGITLRQGTLFALQEDDWRRVIEINLLGPLLGTRAAAPLMRASGGGSIVNIGSAAGMTGHFAIAYSAAKWGLRGVTKASAIELAEWGIRVNTVHPGIVETPATSGSPDFLNQMIQRTPVGHAARAEDIATAVLFLAGDEARFITGVDLPVDGGFLEVGSYWGLARDLKEAAAAMRGAVSGG